MRARADVLPAVSGLAAPVLLVVLWTLAAATGWPGPRTIPSPVDVAQVAAVELVRAEVWRDVGATLARVGAGLAIATVLGVLLGLTLGAAARTWRAARPTVDFLRAIPPILTFPLFLLALGYGEGARVGAIAFGTTGIVLHHVAVALARAPQERADAVRLAGLRGPRAALHLHVYEALPALLVGIRLAFAAALIIAVVTEMLVGAPHGLGGRALEAQLAYRPDRLWFVIVLAGGLGAAFSALLELVERRLVDWR